MARTPAVVYILSACGSGAMEAVAGRPVGGRLPPRAPPSETLPVAATAGDLIGGVVRRRGEAEMAPPEQAGPAAWEPVGSGRHGARRTEIPTHVGNAREVGSALGGPEADGYCPGPRASSREGCVMQTVQDRLTLLLRRNRT